MTPRPTPTSRHLARAARPSFRVFLFILCLLAAPSTLRAQDDIESQHDRGTPPQLAAGVSSAGSYVSADLGSVNLSNGSLNFRIPLGTAAPHTSLSPTSFVESRDRVDDLPVLTRLVLPDATALRFSYNQFGEVAETTLPTGAKIQYDYGQAAAPARPARHTRFEYVAINLSNGLNYADPQVNLRRLLQSRRVYSVNPADGAETLVSHNEVRYDEATYAPLTYPGVVGWVEPPTAARDNQTTTRRWLDTSNTWVETHAQFDQLGQLRFSWDASGDRSEVRYNDSFSDGVNTRNTYAFPTTKVSPVPDPSGQNGSSTPLVATSVYDFSSGLPTSSTDANSKTTSFEYNDPFQWTTRLVKDPSGLAYTTDYTYDALGQLRHFMYDSLGRLVRVRQPEQATNPSLALADSVTGNSQWSLAFAYDADGNISTRTDARGVATTYDYDSIGRNMRVDYSDTTQNPDVERRYDGATNGRGRPWHDSAFAQGGAEGEHSSVDGYDAMGRALNRRQHFLEGGQWSTAYNVQYVYNLAGGTTSVTYPSGRSVAYTYDAAGRLAGFTGNLGDSQRRTYSSETKYDEAGRLQQERFGTQSPVYRKSIYNVRGQLSEIRVGTTPYPDTGWNRGAIINHYSNQTRAGSGTDNNGNLKKQEVYVPRDEANTSYDLFSQFYDYDSLNRLAAACEQTNGGAVTWRQQYDYDRFGNRTISQSGTWGGVPEPACSVSAATNRLGVPAGYTGGMQYDAAGNLTNDTCTGAGMRAYDAEGRLTTAQDSYWQTSHYSYDASGALLAEYAAGSAAATPRKEYGYCAGELLVTAEPTPASTESNLALGRATTQSSTLAHATSLVGSKATDSNMDGNFFAGAASSSTAISGGRTARYVRVQLAGANYLGLAEVEVLGASGAGGPADLRWLVSDHLGTPRMVLDKSGSLAGVSWRDFLPFGEDLYAGGRTIQQGYAGDPVRQKFTGYERDSKTMLDYAQSRYYASAQGRFTSVDPILINPARLTDPQRLNLYAYVRNNPLKYVDPKGRDLTITISKWGIIFFLTRGILLIGFTHSRVHHLTDPHRQPSHLPLTKRFLVMDVLARCCTCYPPR